MVDSDDAGAGEPSEGRHQRQSNPQKEEEEEEEPGPLGLRLTRSPSLIHLIETGLSHENSTTASMSLGNKAEKMKASKFAVSLLRIGCWECAPKYENNLVAKFYFASQKLVWEVFDGSLKNKIEILWSNIMDIKARFPEDGPGTLNIVLAKQPHFFREIEPKPGRHSLWKPTPDFTGDQASTCRVHIIRCPQGEMDSHFYNLIKCDQRLNSMSCLPEITVTSPFFEDAIPHIDPCNGDANCEVIPEDIQANSSNSCWEGLHPSMALGDLIIRVNHSIHMQMASGKSAILPETQVNFHLYDSEFTTRIDFLNGQDATTVEAPQVERWDGSNGLPHPVLTYPSGEEIGGDFPGYNGDCAHGGFAYDQQQQPPLPNLYKDEDGVNNQFSR